MTYQREQKKEGDEFGSGIWLMGGVEVLALAGTPTLEEVLHSRRDDDFNGFSGAGRILLNSVVEFFVDADVKLLFGHESKLASLLYTVNTFPEIVLEVASNYGKVSSKA